MFLKNVQNPILCLFKDRFIIIAKTRSPFSWTVCSIFAKMLFEAGKINCTYKCQIRIDNLFQRMGDKKNSESLSN